MSLTLLPDELLFQIAETVSHTKPDDIEHFGWASRRLRNVAWPLIQEHRKTLEKYTKLHANNAVAADLLFKICRRPWVASYPKTLEAVCNRNLRTLDRPRTVKQIAAVDAFKRKRETVSNEELEDTILRTGLIPSEELSTWMNAVRSGDEDYLFALLLALLPKLERFVIHLDSEKMEQVKEMIRRIKREWSRQRPLPNLKTVQVREKDGARNCDLEVFPLLAAIPGVQKVHGSNLTGMYRDCYRDGWFTYPGASPSITHIWLETCGMSVEGLETLMQSLRHLKEFRYVAHRPGWGLHAISSVLKNARKSLETLVVSTGAGTSRYIGTLREFTALKHVTIDTDMVVRNGRMQRFVDIMPASLETCTITGNSLTESMQDKFLADLFRANFFFPCLKKIRAEDSWGLREIGKERLQFQKEFHKQTTWMARHK